jgi:hypothetical protein
VPEVSEKGTLAVRPTMRRSSGLVTLIGINPNWG